MRPDFFVGARNNLAQPEGLGTKDGATRHRLFTLSGEGRSLTRASFSSSHSPRTLIEQAFVSVINPTQESKGRTLRRC